MCFTTGEMETARIELACCIISTITSTCLSYFKQEKSGYVSRDVISLRPLNPKTRSHAVVRQQHLWYRHAVSHWFIRQQSLVGLPV